MIVTLSQILEAIVLGVGFVLLAIGGVWMIREDCGPDIEMMREARRRDRGAL